MKRSRFSEEQIIGILREAKGGVALKALCGKHNISAATFYAWRKKYGGMDVSEARRLRAIEDWLEDAGIKSMYIEPGAPWENGHIESFHDKLRDECLNRELFHTQAEARVILESWRIEYNERRPHSSLGYLTPSEYAHESNQVDGGYAPHPPRRSPRQAFGGNMGC